MRLGFLGTGKMATALCNGLVDRKVWPAAEICGADVAPQARETFEVATGAWTTDDTATMAAESDVVIVAVKPLSVLTLA